MRIQRTYLVIIGFFLLCFTAGCSSEHELYVNGYGDRVRLELFTRADPYSAPVTRASANESVLDKTPWVLVFSGSGTTATFVEAVQAEVAADGKSYVYLSRQTGPCQLLVLGNASGSFYIGGVAYAYSVSGFESALKSPNLRTLGYACDNMQTAPLSGNQTSIPFVGENLLMSDLVSVSQIDVSVSIPQINLKRTVGKVTVKSTAPDFTLEGIVAVVNTPNQTRLYNYDGALNYFAATGLVEYRTPDDNTYGGYIAPASSNSTADNPVYLYESAAGTSYLIVKGTYEGESLYYKMAFVNDSQVELDINRNREYTFTITAVTGRGFYSAQDAKVSVASNTNLNYSVTVIDLSGHEIQSNNDYYLAVSNSHFELYTNRKYANEPEEWVTYIAFTLTHNCTTVFPVKRTITSLDPDLLTIVSPADGLIPIPSSGVQTLDVQVDWKDAFLSSSADVGGGPVARIEVELGSLKKIITVRRYAGLWSQGSIISNFSPENVKYVSAYIEGYPMTDGTNYMINSTPTSVPDLDNSNYDTWLRLSPGGEAVRNDPHHLYSDTGLISLNFTRKMEYIRTIYLSGRKDDGTVQRIKVLLGFPEPM